MRETSLLRTMTVEEYFRFEEGSEVRHEYVSGELYAMSGATFRHSTLALNVGTRLHAAVGDGPCSVVMNDMRVQVAHDVYYYPDVVVICAPMAQLDITATEPCVVMEVTSPSTARTDRGEKLTAYKQLPRCERISSSTIVGVASNGTRGSGRMMFGSERKSSWRGVFRSHASTLNSRSMRSIVGLTCLPLGSLTSSSTRSDASPISASGGQPSRTQGSTA
jgi:putative restriction endonuclease